MRSALCSAALLGATLVAALPTDNVDKRQGWGVKWDQGDMSGDNNDDQFPIKDGFPDPNDDQLKKIEDGAHGTLSNAPPPPPLNPDTLISLQLVATNELLEVAFYEEFLLNVTNKADGFGDDQFKSDDDRQFLIDTLTVIFQQEELHALNAEGALKANHKPPVEPSEYMFPVNNLQEALAVANILTDNVLAVLQDVGRRAADNGDNELLNGFFSIVGQEGEQNGFFRSEQIIDGKRSRVPSAMPFYTGSARDLAFSGLEQNFIRPGTDKNDIDLNVFLLLTLDTQNIQPENQDLAFEINLDTKAGNDFRGNDNGKGSGSDKGSEGQHKRQESDGNGGKGPIQSSPPAGYDQSGSGSGSGYEGQYGEGFNWGDSNGSKDLYVTYISEQNLPISEPLKDVQFDKDNKVVKFKALFPAADEVIHGFAIATVTHGSNFSNPEEVANATIAGPASIELVD